MKDRHSSGNLFYANENINDFSFDEEFDSSLIANRGEGVDALSVNDFVEKEFDKQNRVLSDKDVIDIAKQGSEAKKAAELYAKLTDKEETESSLIKSEDAEKIDDIYSLYDEESSNEIAKIHDEDEEDDNIENSTDDKFGLSEYEMPDEDDIEDFDSIKHLLTEEEKNNYLKKHQPKNNENFEVSKQDKIKEQAEFEKTLFDALYSDEYKESDEYKDMIFLEKQFDPLVKAPLIEFKKNASIESNLLEPDMIKKNKKFVEITQAPSINNDEITHETSSVEITRDENGEIENIVVVCKCGEKTLIRFDYSDENTAAEQNMPELDDFLNEEHQEHEETEQEISNEEFAEDYDFQSIESDINESEQNNTPDIDSDNFEEDAE
jgi:hypothetical protein